jgi:hypothetical protein
MEAQTVQEEWTVRLILPSHVGPSTGKQISVMKSKK